MTLSAVQCHFSAPRCALWLGGWACAPGVALGLLARPLRAANAPGAETGVSCGSAEIAVRFIRFQSK